MQSVYYFCVTFPLTSMLSHRAFCAESEWYMKLPFPVSIQMWLSTWSPYAAVVPSAVIAAVMANSIAVVCSLIVCGSLCLLLNVSTRCPPDAPKMPRPVPRTPPHVPVCPPLGLQDAPPRARMPPGRARMPPGRARMPLGCPCLPRYAPYAPPLRLHQPPWTPPGRPGLSPGRPLMCPYAPLAHVLTPRTTLLRSRQAPRLPGGMHIDQSTSVTNVTKCHKSC